MYSGSGRLLLTARLGMACCGEGILLVPPTGKQTQSFSTLFTQSRIKTPTKRVLILTVPAVLQAERTQNISSGRYTVVSKT